MPLPNWRLHHAVLPILIVVSLATGRPAVSQTPTDPAVAAAGGISTGAALASLQPALTKVNAAVANLKISRWKAPEDIRSTSLADVTSIERDLEVTLPPILDQAQSAKSPAAPLAPCFAVFRNIDALYDVLLRVTEMANLAGSAVEASRLEDARAALESARAQLADSLLTSVTAQDAQIARFRAQPPVAAKAPPPAAPTKIVVEDGPQSTHKYRKKKPAAAPAPPPSE